MSQIVDVEMTLSGPPGEGITAPELAALQRRVVSWADYGTTAAGLAAAATAAGAGGTVYAPQGPADAPYTYTLESQVVLSEVNLISDGAEISAASDLGSGVAALVFDSPAGDYPNLRAEGFRLYGPTYGARTLGAAPCSMDGIEVTGEAKVHFRDLWVRFFRSGFVLNNVVGHLYWDAVQADNNYYGVYLKSTGYDYYFENCIINGNTFANFGAAAGQGWEGAAWVSSHIGFAPYAFYQESTPATTGEKPFLGDARFDGARFEAIGNAAILSEAPNDASNRNITRNVTITYPGFSWDATYRIAARPRDYAIDIPYTEGETYILGGLYPFKAGDVNVGRIKQANHRAWVLDWEGSQPSDIDVDAGDGPILARGVPVDGVMTVADPGASRIVRITGSAGSYVDFSGDNTRRIGTDNSQMFIDFANFIAFRHSAGAYGTVAGLAPTGYVAPRYYLGNAGSTSGAFITFNAGSPEGVLTAPVGSICTDTTGGNVYRKGSGTGNTGWIAM